MEKKNFKLFLKFVKNLKEMFVVVNLLHKRKRKYRSTKSTCTCILFLNVLCCVLLL